MRRAILAAVAVALVAVWLTGRLDYMLYPVGLNHGQCARNGLGATFCDGDLIAYQAHWQAVQRQIQGIQVQAREAECRADPALSVCQQP